MNDELSKNTGQPYYLQLKEILKHKIRDGQMHGKKLPPVRHLAAEYGISVNTVLRAYSELEKEGLISSSVGRGTFVTTSPQDLERQNRENLIRKIIEHAVEEALSLEVSLEDFEAEVIKYIQEKKEMMQKIKLCFIECNIEQANYFTEHLELDPYIHRFPILIDDLKHKTDHTIEQIKESDIIVTSFHHLDEVHEYLAPMGKPIIGINLEPQVQTLIEIAKIPSSSVLGIVTTSEQFRKIIREILDGLQLSFEEILESNSEDEETIQELVRACDAVLVSPKRKELVRASARPETRVIEFIFTPDRTSINNLKVAIIECKNGLL
jgi:GntR family transcriptional regulator